MSHQSRRARSFCHQASELYNHDVMVFFLETKGHSDNDYDYRHAKQSALCVVYVCHMAETKSRVRQRAMLHMQA